MSTESKTRIYKTCTRAILTYAADRAEQEQKHQKQKIRLNRIRNADTLRELEVQNVVRWVRARRRCCRDHVDRMGPD